MKIGCWILRAEAVVSYYMLLIKSASKQTRWPMMVILKKILKSISTIGTISQSKSFLE